MGLAVGDSEAKGEHAGRASCPPGEVAWKYRNRRTTATTGNAENPARVLVPRRPQLPPGRGVYLAELLYGPPDRRHLRGSIRKSPSSAVIDTWIPNGRSKSGLKSWVRNGVDTLELHIYGYRGLALGGIMPPSTIEQKFADT